MASSSKSGTCSSLPDDILIEIFIYLPLNSVYKFRCLSKVWLSNLSNPTFLTKWFQINEKYLPWIQYRITPSKISKAYPDSHSRLISRNDYGFSFEFLRNEKSFPGSEEIHPLCSSNGLVLLGSRTKGFQSFHVCNPLTQEWVSIPSPPGSRAYSYGFYGIVCDNSLSGRCCYKVVCIPRFSFSKKFSVDMFCSDLGEWTSFEVSCDEDVYVELNNNVITPDGVLYWMVGESRKMLVYNLNQNNKSNEHRCSLVDLPLPRFVNHDFSGKVNSSFSHIIGESEGRICYVRTKVTGRQISVSVWMFDEDNWHMLHKDISIQSFQMGSDESVWVIGFSPVDRNVILIGSEHRVWCFNIQTRSVEELIGSSVLTASFMLKAMPKVLPPPTWIDS